MIKKNGGIFGRNPTYNDVVVEGTLTMKEAQVFDNDITINGDLTVNGTETVINTVELNVDDKNITMGAVVAKVGLTATTNITAGQFTVQLADTSGLIPGMTVAKTSGTGAFGASPKIASVDSHTQITLTVAHATSGTIIFDTGGATDDTADGGGITLKGTTDKFIKWVKASVAWVFSDPIKAPDVTVDNLTASLPVFTDANKKLVTQSQQNALNAIAGAVTSARFLRGDGTNVSMSAIQASDVPTLNQNTSGTAAGLSATLVIASGGTNNTSFTAKSGNVAGLVFFDGTKLANDATVTDVGYDTVTHTLTANNFSASGTVAINTNAFYVDPTNKRVGIGNASPSRSLTITGSGAAFTSALNPTIRLDNTASGRAAIIELDSAQALTIWNSDAGIAGADTIFKYGSGSGTENFRLTNGGDAKIANGNLVIGTSGKGIDFSVTANGSGTMSSELLDDYEWGYFTPSIAGSSSAGTGTYAYRIGRYTKVGNRVMFNIMIDWSGHTGTGFLRVTGLPFTSYVSAPYYHGVTVGYADALATTAGTMIHAFVPNNATQIYIGEIPTGGGTFAYVAMDAAGTLVLSGQYEV